MYNREPDSDGRYPVGTAAKFQCAHGYRLQGNARHCLASGRWDGTQPDCTLSKLFTSSITLWLLNKHQLWQNSCIYISFSIVVLCEALSLENGLLTYNTRSKNGGYVNDTVASFECSSNLYKLSGGSQSTCTSTGWKPKPSTCDPSEWSMIYLI